MGKITINGDFPVCFSKLPEGTTNNEEPSRWFPSPDSRVYGCL